MAVLQYASDFANESMHWAVTEAQKCFNAPLDHTRHHPIEPFPELVNKPTGNPYFDRLLKSDTDLPFLELTNSNEPGRVTSPNEVGVKKCSDPKSAALWQSSASCLQVVVLREDGTRDTHKHNLAMCSGNVERVDPSKKFEEDHDDLTKRSSPSVVIEAVQQVLQNCIKPKDGLEGMVLGITSEGDQSNHNTNPSKPGELDAKACQDEPECARNSNQDAMIQDVAAEQPQNTQPENSLSVDTESNIAVRDVAGEQPQNTQAKNSPSAEPESNITAQEVASEQPQNTQAENSPSAKVESNISRGELSGTLPNDSNERIAWNTGSVLEVFSASANNWFPGLVTELVQIGDRTQDLLTAQFWLNVDDAKKKTVCRSSEQLAPIGTHCGDQLPPGFEVAFSRSRPGMFVFLDGTTGLKYDSLALTWAVHFKRWLERPAQLDGMDTISSVAPVVASRATTRQLSDINQDVLGLATQAAPAAVTCDTKVCEVKAAQDIVAQIEAINNHPCEASHATDTIVKYDDGTALFLDAMAHETPGPYSLGVATKPQCSRTIDQHDVQMSVAVAETAAERSQATLDGEWVANEFFACLPEPNREQSPKKRALRNLLSQTAPQLQPMRGRF